MLRLIIAATIGLVIGAALTAGVLIATYPPPGTLTCSMGENRTVNDCTDENGKQVKVPHDVKIR